MKVRNPTKSYLFLTFQSIYVIHFSSIPYCRISEIACILQPFTPYMQYHIYKVNFKLQYYEKVSISFILIESKEKIKRVCFKKVSIIVLNEILQPRAMKLYL